MTTRNHKHLAPKLLTDEDLERFTDELKKRFNKLLWPITDELNANITNDLGTITYD